MSYYWCIDIWYTVRIYIYCTYYIYVLCLYLYTTCYLHLVLSSVHHSECRVRMASESRSHPARTFCAVKIFDCTCRLFGCLTCGKELLRDTTCTVMLHHGPRDRQSCAAIRLMKPFTGFCKTWDRASACECINCMLSSFVIVPTTTDGIDSFGLIYLSSILYIVNY